MMHLKRFFLINNIFIFILATLFGLFFLPSAQASTTDGTIVTGGDIGFAWSNNAGWVNFGDTNGNVHVTDVKLTGDAWSKRRGWLNLQPTNSGVTNNGNGVLAGSAWGSSLGWVNFSGVTIDANGRFHGQATGVTIGTLTFDCDNCNVQTDWRPASSRVTASGGSVARSSPFSKIRPRVISYFG